MLKEQALEGLDFSLEIACESTIEGIGRHPAKWLVVLSCECSPAPCTAVMERVLATEPGTRQCPVCGDWPHLQKVVPLGGGDK